MEFWLVAVIWWEVPIPTEFNSNVSGICCKALAALSANLNPELENLTTYNSLGSLVVDTPATVAALIPTALTVLEPV